MTSDVSTILGDRRKTGLPVVLELGCGSSKQAPHYIGVDVLDRDGVDIVGSAEEVVQSFPPGSVDEVTSRHFLEHLDDFPALLAAAALALKPGGVFTATVPHFSNPHFYSDPTHRQAFGLYTMNYLVESTFTRRRVPQYQTPLPFVYESARYRFGSERPNYLRHAWLKRGNMFNASGWLQELYEELFCWRIPAYDLTYTLRRL